MDSATFNKFRQLIYDKSGICLGEQKDALVSARVGKRMRNLGINDFRQYHSFLSSDDSGNEIVELLDAISTNVTHFFRENQHFEFLSSIARKWEAQGQRSFRIWSAACSTGEEPYSIAMTLREAMTNCTDAKILATDISTKVLQKAKQGVYEERHVENVLPAFRSRYFLKGSGERQGLYQIKKSLREMITYGRINLSVSPYPLKGPLDAIFCRNVMIYFDNQVRRQVLDSMNALLKPGGYLFVGHAESLTGLVSDFRSVMPSVYVKG